jgi:hypothetical protein
MYRIILLIAFSLILSGSLFSEEITKTIDVNEGGTLNVELKTGGSIHVEGWDQKQVQVEVSFRHSSLEPGDVNIDKSGNVVNIRIDDLSNGNHSGNVPVLTINVPKKFNIEVETMGGEIEITDVEGKFSGQTMGGSLKLKMLKGNIHMTTMGGRIYLSDSDIDGELKTMGGDVYFENVYGDIKGSTMGGEVTMKNVQDSKGKNAGEVKISTMGGDINVDDAPQGADVHTMGGDITIKRAKRFVKAKTMGGEIDIREVDGSVKASTMGGEVTVVLVGDGSVSGKDIDLSSMGGEITLTLPKNISAKFELHLTYTKDSKQDYEIISDFDLKVEEKTKDWEYKKGSPRKEIEGKGQVGDGKNSIYIKTINGNIRIKKGA